MSNSYRSEIIIWFNTPPKVSKGAFNYLTRMWGEKVYYICDKDYPQYRKAVNWDDGDYGDAEMHILEEKEDKASFIRQMFVNHPNAIHVLSGFNNEIEKKVRRFILSSNKHLVVFSERPVEVGDSFEKCMRLLFFQLKYRYYYFLYGKRVDVFLPLGIRGVQTFKKYGWPEELMMPFMYNPTGSLIESHSLIQRESHDAIRFLYVGRFYYRTKGVDVLMKAVKYLRGKWTLDLVGGYGKKASEVKAWIEATENVFYAGSWPSEEVSHRMSKYDVVIVPSKYDGWNLLVNEAINAGVGVIVSDQAVSDEVIQKGKAGLVFHSGKSKELAEAMQTVIDDPSIVNDWHDKAILTSQYISPETVGKYLIDVLDFFIYGKGQRPLCPWLNQDIQ